MPNVDSSCVVNIADLRRLAQQRLPKVVFDYIDGGADAELTLRENCRVFDDVLFRPKNAVAMPDCDLRTTVCGTTIALPFVLAPVGSSRMFYPRGEIVAAGAAGRGRHDLHVVDAVGVPGRRGQGRHEGADVVSGLPGRRT